MLLNNDIDRSSLSQSAFTFGFFSNNVRTLSTSYLVTADRLVPEYPLILFKLLPKLRYFAIFLHELFARRFVIER